LHATSGHFAVLTNVYEPCAIPMTDNLTSRGKLVDMFIKGEFDQETEKILQNWKDFMGFNLVFGNVRDFLQDRRPRILTSPDTDEPALFYISNRSKDSPGKPQAPTRHKICNGVHCVSNSFLDDFEWPKVKYLRDEIEKVVTNDANMNASAQHLCNQLAQLLTARPLFPAEKVQQYIVDETIAFCNRAQNKGSEVIVAANSNTDIPFTEMVNEIMDSCQNIFVDYADFKTKSQTIMLVHKSGKVHFAYRNTDELIVPVPLLPFSQEMVESNIADIGWEVYELHY
jgi:uncharacterized protein with NRDE domain